MLFHCATRDDISRRRRVGRLASGANVRRNMAARMRRRMTCSRIAGCSHHQDFLLISLSATWSRALAKNSAQNGAYSGQNKRDIAASVDGWRTGYVAPRQTMAASARIITARKRLCVINGARWRRWMAQAGSAFPRGERKRVLRKIVVSADQRAAAVRPSRGGRIERRRSASATARISGGIRSIIFSRIASKRARGMRINDVGVNGGACLARRHGVRTRQKYRSRSSLRGIWPRGGVNVLQNQSFFTASRHFAAASVASACALTLLAGASLIARARLRGRQKGAAFFPRRRWHRGCLRVTPASFRAPARCVGVPLFMRRQTSALCANGVRTNNAFISCACSGMNDLRRRSDAMATAAMKDFLVHHAAVAATAHLMRRAPWLAGLFRLRRQHALCLKQNRHMA